MTETVLHGRPAAPGLYAGPLFFLLIDQPRLRRSPGDAASEARTLRHAVAAALADTMALVARAEGEAAEMMGFQAAMLEDAELVRAPLSAIAEGVPADIAWTQAMEAEIAGYEAAEDAYFRARTADLQDITDRVLARLTPPNDQTVPPRGAIIVATDLPLSQFLALDWSQGGAILLRQGSPTSHVAMLARARQVPMVVGLGDIPPAHGAPALVDATAGEVVIDPSPTRASLFQLNQQDSAREANPTWLTTPARTADGTHIAVHLNIVGPDELSNLNPAICDGIGLFRTEFLFHATLPDEDTQYRIYRTVMDWAQGRKVTIRTLDAGGDKPLPGITLPAESNPFLGLRGLRLSLRYPDLFRVQLRALLRASRHGPLQIMLPMVTIPAELEAARALLQAEIQTFARAGNPVPHPPLGIMVEVPAAAIAIERFDAAFFSIGSNDLTQYVTAAGRDMADVADLADPTNPAVLQLIETVVRHGHATARDVSLCGDAGGDPTLLPALLATGLRAISVSPGLLAGARRALTGINLPSPA